MAAVTASLLDLERTKGKVEFVVDDDDSLSRNFEILRESSDRPTGGIHIPRRHRQDDRARRNAGRKSPRLLLGECDSCLGGPLANRFLANVVTGRTVLITWVSQANNEPTRLTTRGGGFATSKEQRLLLRGFFSRGFSRSLFATLGGTLCAFLSGCFFDSSHTRKHD